jgi:hypothetical protein
MSRELMSAIRLLSDRRRRHIHAEQERRSATFGGTLTQAVLDESTKAGVEFIEALDALFLQAQHDELLEEIDANERVAVDIEAMESDHFDCLADMDMDT